MIKPVLAAASLLALSGTALAQQAPPPNPCETEAAYGHFDFWLGDWNVYGQNHQFAGVNRITKTENDCLIRENWHSANNTTGFSMNFYDAGQEAWHQVWVSLGAQIDYTGGLDEDGAMRLEGEIVYPGQGTRAPFRGSWALQDNGEVIQSFHQQNTETGEWSVWFIGRYVPVESDGENETADALWAHFD